MSKETLRGNQLRQAVLLAAAGTTAFVAATVLAPRDEGQMDVVPPVIRSNAQARPVLAPAGVSLLPRDDANDAVPERLAGTAEQNPFAPLNLHPPAVASLGAPNEAVAKPIAATKPKAPEPAVATTAAPPPVAPPLPFKAVGSIQGRDVTGGKPVAFLQQQDQVFLVGAGDNIGGIYRVEAITTEMIDFTYLPLGQRQVLALLP